ncbi:MAG: rhodanese-like domain-containing protein [Pseudomonas sp.]|uniref:rhodanese-like domain-containing protein n=1 Tax=Pseudomonas sp. TaxID=306 RepID=UPI003D0B4759
MRTLAAVFALLTALPLSAAEVDQPAALNALLEPDAVLIDVRTPEEFAEGALAGATRVDPEAIVEQIATLAPDKDTPIVLYCRSGRRSGNAQDALAAQGYTQVINAGGYEELNKVLEQQD